jgi:hypothetical protein
VPVAKLPPGPSATLPVAEPVTWLPSTPRTAPASSENAAFGSSKLCAWPVLI